MHNNQFAITNADLETEINELQKIGFLEKPELPIISATALWQEFLIKSLPNFQTISSKNEQLAQLQANAKLNLLDFLKQDNVTEKEFYNVALQLLGFSEGVDYILDNPFPGMDQIGLPRVHFQEKYWESCHIIEAWYLLLNTHNKTGLNFLDFLAANGFYKDYTGKVPLFFAGKAQAVISPSQLIREVVYVETDIDTDLDGMADLVKVEIIRPNIKEKLPIILTANPYGKGINNKYARERLHNPYLPINRKTPNNTTYEDIKFHKQVQPSPTKRKINAETTVTTETFNNKFNYSLNDFFLTRGFVNVYTTGIGGRGSDGISNCGSVAETNSITAVIEWLTNSRVAFTNKTDGIKIKAHFSNGKVAMTGKSYLGTLAIAAATTGVSGLKAIISEAAISNWYQYYRDNGLVVAPGGFLGEDADVLAALIYSKKQDLADWQIHEKIFNKNLAEMVKYQDRLTGNYNQFWDERNYLPQVKNIKAAVLIVHGLNDWNVKPRQAGEFWQELEKTNVEHKIILHQGQHIFINNNRSLDFSDICNLWLAQKLCDVDNHAAEILPKIIWQSNSTPEKWVTLENWENDLPKDKQTFYFENGKLTKKQINKHLSFRNDVPTPVFRQFIEDSYLWQKEILKINASILKNNRLLFLSDKLTKDCLLKGTPKLKLRVSSSADKGMLSCLLVDYGKAKRLTTSPILLSYNSIPIGQNFILENVAEFAHDKETASKIISRGHLNLQNRKYPWKNDELRQDEFVDVDLALHPTIYHLPKGRMIGLIIYSTDFEMTVRSNEKIFYTIDLGNSKLQLPIN